MKSFYRYVRYVLALGGLGLVAAAGACSHDTMLTGARGGVRANIALVRASGPAAPAASIIGLLKDEGDSGHEGFLNQISLADVDSLTVNVTKVEVHVEMPDSERPDSASERPDSSEGEHADSGRGEGDDHENDEATWVSLDVTAGGHVDLLKLPDSASGGISIASGTLAPGTYRHVRLFVTGPMIFLKHMIVTPTGDTLKAGVGLPVIIPSADSTGAAIKTDQSFTVPSGGGTVKLVFDADDTVRHIVVTGDGKIILAPVLRAREDGDR